jgi:Tol biopolymer transport system component
MNDMEDRLRALGGELGGHVSSTGVEGEVRRRAERRARFGWARLPVVVVLVVGLTVGGWALLGKAFRSAGPVRPVATRTGPTAPVVVPPASVTPPPSLDLTGTIAFEAWKGGLYLLDVATGATQKVDTEAGCCSMAWSPDGTGVAFTVGRGEGKGDVVVSHLDGSTTVVASLNSAGPPDPCCPQDVAWAPDGSQLVFTSGEGEVFTVGANGSHLARITDHTQDRCADRRVSWSPATGLIVSARQCPGSGNSGIYTFTSSGANVTKLLAVAGEPMGISLSPDGERIAFALSRKGLFVVNADGSGLTRLTHAWDSSPTWSPDGSVIAFSRAAQGQPYEVWAVPASGGQAVRVADLTTEPVWVAWRPVP